MKFLCVACDEPMKLAEVVEAGGGSLTVRYGCPSCEHQVAMLTNPYETEVVQSLGVKIGPDGGRTGGGCPFSGMVGDAAGGRPATSEPASDEVRWTAEALARLDNIPELVRPMARMGIEHYAKTAGYRQVDEVVLEEARGRFGM